MMWLVKDDMVLILRKVCGRHFSTEALDTLWKEAFLEFDELGLGAMFCPDRRQRNEEVIGLV